MVEPDPRMLELSKVTYQAIGMAVAMWSHLERQLNSLFWAAAPQSDDRVTMSILFSTIQGLEGRFRAVDALIQHRLEGEERKTWNGLAKRFKTARDDRNRIAHWLVLRDGESFAMFQPPNLHDDDHALDTKPRKNVNEILDISRGFQALATDLSAFVQVVIRSRKTPPSPE